MKQFEWDELKRENNIEKHGLDFVDGIKVFEDTYHIERLDNRFSYEEPRFQSIGKVKVEGHEFIVFLVWTPRNKKKRIISCRLAHKTERRVYYEKQK